MANRYRERQILLNNNEIYKEIFRKRNVKSINQYDTPYYKFPKDMDFSKFTMNSYTWKVGDSFYKLADRFYNDATAWWVIAKFNNKPTESHVAIGDTIYIPTPLPIVLNYLTG